MDQIVIRSAVDADMDRLLFFEQGVISAERPFDSTLRPGHIQYYDLPEMITAPHIELAVAVLNGTIIGSGYARIENARHYLQHRQHAYLGFMYTDPPHRGQGVNNMIIQYLSEWAAARNINELVLDVYSGNTAAINAYKKAGFDSLMIQMRKGISSASC